MAAIFYVSSLPEVPVAIGSADKTVHGLAYLGLAVLTCRALSGGCGRRVSPRAAVMAILITAGYGATDEFHQTFVPGRSAEWNDLAADAIGACAGTVVSWAWGIIASTSRPARGASRDEL